MDKKLVIEELEKARVNLLEYGVSTEQLKAINYAIKIFKASSDLELLLLNPTFFVFSNFNPSKAPAQINRIFVVSI